MIARLNDECFESRIPWDCRGAQQRPSHQAWPLDPLADGCPEVGEKKALPKFGPLGSKPAAVIPPQGAFLFSLVVPGAGQFCLGQYFIGIMFLVMAIGCWLVRFFIPDLDFNFMLWAVHLVPAAAAGLTAYARSECA